MLYKIRKQINFKGYHAGFELESSFVKEAVAALQIDFDIDTHSEKWKDSTIEGISIFYNNYQDVFKGKLTTTISKIDWFPVDTSELLIRYFIIRVLCEIHQLDYIPLINPSKFATLYNLNQMSFVFKIESLSYCLE